MMISSRKCTCTQNKVPYNKGRFNINVPIPLPLLSAHLVSFCSQRSVLLFTAEMRIIIDSTSSPPLQRDIIKYFTLGCPSRSSSRGPGISTTTTYRQAIKCLMIPYGNWYALFLLLLVPHSMLFIHLAFLTLSSFSFYKYILVD